MELEAKLCTSGSLILIGSGAQRGIGTPLPENSMDVDPVTDSDEIAMRCHDAMIGSEFELRHGWHVNLMPEYVLRELPADWETRAAKKLYGALTALVPAPEDLLVPKRKRNEPRDRAHEVWARQVGLLSLPS